MDKLLKSKIIKGIKNTCFEKVLVFNKIDSTSTFARSQLIGTVIFAETQTQGRGRQGKSFLSKKGGLYFSFVLSPSQITSLQLTTAVAVAVSDAIDKTCNVETQIKWVNDIFLDGKKIAGILTENLGDKIIIGIGINFYPVELGVLRNTAKSIYEYSKQNVTRTELAIEILKEIDSILKLKPKDYMDSYRKKSCVLNRQIKFFHNTIEQNGQVTAILDDGTLIVQNENGKYILNSGTILLI